MKCLIAIAVLLCCSIAHSDNQYADQFGRVIPTRAFEDGARYERVGDYILVTSRHGNTRMVYDRRPAPQYYAPPVFQPQYRPLRARYDRWTPTGYGYEQCDW